MSIGRSRYDGLNLSFRQRSFHKVDMTANYTLARAVGYDEDGGSFRYYPRDPQNPLASSEFGPSFNDERHHLTIAATAHLPGDLSSLQLSRPDRRVRTLPWPATNLAELWRRQLRSGAGCS